MEISEEYLSILKQTENDLNRPGRPPLCVDCEHIVKNQYSGADKEICLHPLNYRGINLVNGYRVLKAEFCYLQRSTRNPDLCGISGTWFKEHIPLPPMITTIQSTNITPADKFAALRKGKLTSANLDNL